jgi:hypothetical protein
MAESLNLEEVQKIVNAVLAGVADRAYSLKEVAERTGFAFTELERDCKRGLIEHTWRGRTRCMTSRQVAKLLDQYRVGGAAVQPKVSPAQQEAVDLASVRTSSQGAAKRTSRRRAA